MCPDVLSTGELLPHFVEVEISRFDSTVEDQGAFLAFSGYLK